MSKRLSVEQLSSTVSEAGTNVTSDKRLGQSFYNRIDYVADRIADESEIRSGKEFPYQYFASYLNAGDLWVHHYIWGTPYGNAGKGGCLRVIRMIGIEREIQDPFRKLPALIIPQI